MCLSKLKIVAWEFVSPLNKGGLRGDLLLAAASRLAWDKSPQPPLLRGAFADSALETKGRGFGG